MESIDRSFTVVGAYKPGQQMQRTSHGTGRYISKTPKAAASKALSEHCDAKKIRGVCTLTIVIQETTAGSAKKMYAYKGKRHRVDKTVEVGSGKNKKEIHYKYKNELKSTDVPKHARPHTK